ncbi:MAG: NAD(P)-dependent oxidoreductase [Pyrinomonadaceae bacterium]|nr:NAD(P)-dependent oxidoreductase [Pyrinomonadaceae bacterium]
MANDYCSPLEITQIERNFSEINPAFSAAEAMHEANRCLFCYDAPCIQACPTGIDVPSFIKKIATGNLHGSARVIFDANPIGASCARVCPVEVLCEGACVEKTLLKKPIEIGRLQRHATDFAMASGRPVFTKGESNGKSVGIVGSGPAGLSCGTYLARLGYDVTVYERKAQAGGLDTYGMAEYKMPKSVSLSEVEYIAGLGVKFILNTQIVRGATPDSEILGEVNAVGFDVLNEWHDAIFLATGLGETNKLNIPGEDLDGVYDALEFIEKIKTRDWMNVPLGKNVAVIGAGNTAIDAVTQAKRLGAEKVTLIYRRTEKDAPAYEYEMELARKDGIQFMWETTPVEIGGISSVGGMRVRQGNTEFKIDCDMVIKAIGQQKMATFFTDVAGVAVDEKGRVVINDQMQTSNPKIFSGGDCANGGAEAVDASQMGKLAAQGIHQTLTGEAVKFAGAK